jgi:branched-chain amino acid transport system substrate-binding protein
MTPKLALVIAAALLATPATAQIKIAYIDPLTGPFADVGGAGLKHFQAMAEKINAGGGVLGGQKLEIVPFDSKSSPQEALIDFQSALDQGIRIVTQGNGSNVAAALIDAANKTYQRTPDKAVLFLNYAAVDPDLTNAARCSFWHFRFDANTEQKLEAITTHLAKQKDLKKVYVIGQDYAHGHQISRISKELLKKKRPDIAIVGDDLHPTGKVKDFTPYVTKIKASGAGAVITGNWGNDLSLLVKAAKDVGLTATFYTYYAGSIGTPTAMGAAGAGHVAQVSEWHPNLEGNKAEAFVNEYNKKNSHEFWYLRVKNEMEMLANAIDRAKSADPIKVALALEGMHYQADAGEVWMRKEDHQLIQPMVLSIFEKAGQPGVKYQTEKTGYGFKTLTVVSARDLEVTTTCQMTRP